MFQHRKVPDNALAALRSGAPASDIANLLGVDVGTVYRYKTAAKAAGLIESVVPASDAALIACYLDGETIPAIARRLGIGRSSATVYPALGHSSRSGRSLSRCRR